jgi:UDP-GlcNAc:undecaprenyl-phosphate GlcNAc-1-phosphate transferase
MLLAAAICYLVTPYVETYALRFGAIARVRTRDIHTETTPRWGGVAMWWFHIYL